MEDLKNTFEQHYGQVFATINYHTAFIMTQNPSKFPAREIRSVCFGINIFAP